MPPLPPSSPPKVALIGVDAAEWSHIQQLIRDGVMPELDKVLQSSDVGKLSGDMSFRAESTWTQALTGRGVKETDYWSTVEFDPATYTTWQVGAYRGTPFFARPDLRTVALDVPHSALSPDVPGIQVTAWGAHSPQFPTASWPHDVIGRLDREVGVHPAALSDSYNGWFNDDYGRNLTDALVKGAALRVDAVEWLLAQEADWRLLFTVIGEPHAAGHQFLHGIDPAHPLHRHPAAGPAAQRFSTVYRAVDDAIGRLVHRLGDEAEVVVFAVHGMQVNSGDVSGGVLLPELLYRLQTGEALLDFPEFDPAGPPLDLPPTMVYRNYIMSLMRQAPGPRPSSALARVKNEVRWRMLRELSPENQHRVRGALRRARPGEPAPWWWEMRQRPPATGTWRDAADDGRKELDYLFPTLYADAWPSMKAFAIPAFSDGHIRLNVAGRERNGVVPPSEYDQVCDWLEEELRSCVDGRTGRPVVDDITRVRAEDPMAPGGAPADLVVTFCGVSDAIRHPRLGVLGPVPFQRAGEHTSDGWVAHLNRSGSGHDLGTWSASDIGPSAIELLGLPPSPATTGTPFLRAR